MLSKLDQFNECLLLLTNFSANPMYSQNTFYSQISHSQFDRSIYKWWFHD